MPKDNYRIEKRTPTTDEFQFLRGTTNWSKLSNKTVEIGLRNSLYSVCVMESNRIVATGRIVGDNAIYFYIQDVMVIPEYQKRGLGKMIMKYLLDYIEQQNHENAFVGLMSAVGVKGFYKKLGFAERTDDRPGMSILLPK